MKQKIALVTVLVGICVLVFFYTQKVTVKRDFSLLYNTWYVIEEGVIAEMPILKITEKGLYFSEGKTTTTFEIIDIKKRQQTMMKVTLL